MANGNGVQNGKQSESTSSEGGDKDTFLSGAEDSAADKDKDKAKGGDGKGGAAETPEAKAAAEKAAAEKKAADDKAKAGEFELKLPEGLDLDGKALTALAKEAGLKQEHAQKFVDFYASAQKAAIEKAEAEFDSLQKKWVEELKADKEIGGANWKASRQAAARVMAKYGSPELKELLNQSGLGNRRELVELFVKVGKAMSEDSSIGAGPGNGTKRPATPEDRLKREFPTMFKEAK